MGLGRVPDVSDDDEERLQKQLASIKGRVTKAAAHANMARSEYNSHKGKMDCVDKAQTLALVAQAEALSAGMELLLMIVEEGK